MKKFAALILLLAALLGGIALFQRRASPPAGMATLTVYCAAGLKKPVEAIAQAYQKEAGVEVRLQFGGSGTLLSQFRVVRQGDLFLSADEGAIADARQVDLIREVLPLAKQHPVIAVRAGNPKNIHTLTDLLRGDVKLALANPEAASISRVSQRVLGATWTQLAAHAAVMKPTVTEVAGDLALGTVDAAILWDAIVAQFPGTAAVEVPELSSHHENASAAVLACSRQPAAALRFARYLCAPEKGGAVFQSLGFTPAGGDAWVP